MKGGFIMTYFNPTPKTVEQLKKMYKKLAMQYHPDLGGSTEVMQQVIGEYDTLFTRLKNVHETAAGEVYTETEKTTEMPEDFRDIISRIISIDGIEIELIGNWIWVYGNTYPHRDTLKGLKFRWSKSKQCWYWHGADYAKVGRKTFDLETIRGMWGSTKIEKESRHRFATA